MARKWFQLVGADGNALASTTSVVIDKVDVDSFRKAVKIETARMLEKYAPAQLIVFANKAVFDTKQAPLGVTASLVSLGSDACSPLVVVVPVPSDQEPAPKKARTWSAISDEVIASIGSNLDIDAWRVGGQTLGIHQVEADFPEWFYVRQATRDIFQIFKSETTALGFVGTPGVGKSMLVVLLAFYKALRQNKRVILYRKRKGMADSMLYLDTATKSYLRKEDANFGDVRRVMEAGVELCLDGFTYEDIKSQRSTLGQFRLLATSTEYTLKDDDLNVLQLCLVPFWSLSDLKAIGAHRRLNAAEIEDKYYYSGGNVRAFLAPTEHVKASINRAITQVSEDTADLLQAQYASASAQQIDRIRMTAISTNGRTRQSYLAYLTKYLDCSEWMYEITSEYAMIRLSTIVQPSFYEKLWSTGKLKEDDGLMGICIREPRAYHVKE